MGNLLCCLIRFGGAREEQSRLEVLVPHFCPGFTDSGVCPALVGAVKVGVFGPSTVGGGMGKAAAATALGTLILRRVLGLFALLVIFSLFSLLLHFLGLARVLA